MSETKWTLGKWYVTEDEQDERVSIASVLPSDVTVVAAHVHQCDAPLLLAAPRLYAALVEAVEAIEWRLPPEGECRCAHDFRCVSHRALDIAWAALRKARGEE